jgi:hypothetical protein
VVVLLLVVGILGSPHHGTGVAGVAVDLVPSPCPTACQQPAGRGHVSGYVGRAARVHRRNQG